MKNFKPESSLKGKRGSPNYPLDPFHNNYLKLAKSIKNWQIAFLTVILLLFISSITIFKLITQASITPYIVEVNKEAGIVKNIGELNKISYNPGDALIISYLRKHILATRSIPLDQIIYGKNIQEEYNFLNKISQKKLVEYISKDNVQQFFKNKESRDISITSILKLDDKNYQVRWIENNYSETGNIFQTIKMVGVFTVEQKKENNNEEKMLINPLGITISDFSFSKEL